VGRSPLEWLGELIRKLLDWLVWAQHAHPTTVATVRVILAVLGVGLLAHMSYIVWRVLRPSARTPEGAGGSTRPSESDDAALARAQAEASAQAGRYAEALAHRFLSMVLELDRRRALTFHPSKTPAEYVNEAHLDGLGRASLGDLVARLYRHVFGALPCDAEAYRQFASDAEFVSGHVATG